jgi:hypothetical protein
MIFVLTVATNNPTELTMSQYMHKFVRYGGGELVYRCVRVNKKKPKDHSWHNTFQGALTRIKNDLLEQMAKDFKVISKACRKRERSFMRPLRKNK